MLMQTGVEAQIQTLVTLAGTTDFQGTKRLCSLHELKVRYRRFLAALSQRSIDIHGREPAYVTTAKQAEHLATLFSNDSILDDKLQSDVITRVDDPERAQKQARVEDALRELSRYSSSYAAVFRTIVTDIFILPSAVARAGSTSGAIGAIWLNPKLSHPVADLMEILVHECSHQAMFLDELRYGHYAYESIANPSAWATSAILNLSRPLDKVLHSVVVAAEVLLLRDQHIGHPTAPRAHPPTDILVQQLEESLISIDAITRKFPTIFMPRANKIVANIRRLLGNRAHANSNEPTPARAR